MAEIDDIIFARTALQSGRAREIRDQAGLSRETMARELGCAATTLYKWETSDPRPRVRDNQMAARYGALLRRLEAQHTNEHTESELA